MAARPPRARASLIAFVRARRRALLAVFMGAELAVLLLVAAENAWPRAIPEAFGWAVFLGSYPWSLPWLAAGKDDIAWTMIVVTAAFSLNVVLLAIAAGYAWSRWREARA
jgi:hypothetical protein